MEDDGCVVGVVDGKMLLSVEGGRRVACVKGVGQTGVNGGWVCRVEAAV